MIAYDCGCGLRIDFEAAHVGRRARCKRCGSVFRVPAPDTLLPGREPPAPEGTIAVAPGRPAPAPPPPEAARLTHSRSLHERQVAARRRHGFWPDAWRSFMLWTDPMNLVAMVSIAVILLISDLIPIVFISVPLMGLVYGYYMEAIATVAGGEDSLPTFSEWDGFWESGVEPFLIFLATFVVVFIPALLAALILGENPTGLWTAGVVAALGAFMWPMTILGVAVSGPGIMLRPDLLVRSVFAALPPYLLIWALLVLAIVLQPISIGSAIGAVPAPYGDWLQHPVAVYLLVTVGSAYASLIVVRLIGLYYRHYSDRFPWSGG